MNLTTFNFKQVAVRVVKDTNGNPWFIAMDVWKVLEIGNVSQTMNRLGNDEKSIIVISGINSNGVTQKLNMIAINESGLYCLISASHKPEAKAFKKWVTSEVLPSICKNKSCSVDEQKQINYSSIDDIARYLILIDESVRVSNSVKPKSLHYLHEHCDHRSNSLHFCASDTTTATAEVSEPSLSVTEW